MDREERVGIYSIIEVSIVMDIWYGTTWPYYINMYIDIYTVFDVNNVFTWHNKSVDLDSILLFS